MPVPCPSASRGGEEVLVGHVGRAHSRRRSSGPRSACCCTTWPGSSRRPGRCRATWRAAGHRRGRCSLRVPSAAIGFVGEARVLGVDPAVDHPDDDVFAGVVGAAEPGPQPVGEAEEVGGLAAEVGVRRRGSTPSGRRGAAAMVRPIGRPVPLPAPSSPTAPGVREPDAVGGDRGHLGDAAGVVPPPAAVRRAEKPASVVRYRYRVPCRTRRPHEHAGFDGVEVAAVLVRLRARRVELAARHPGAGRRQGQATGVRRQRFGPELDDVVRPPRSGRHRRNQGRQAGQGAAGQADLTGTATVEPVCPSASSGNSSQTGQILLFRPIGHHATLMCHASAMGADEPSPWIARFASLLPPGGPVLDVASGSGRHTRFFLGRGTR